MPLNSALDRQITVLPSDSYDFTSVTDNRNAILSLAKFGRNTIDLISRDLDRRLYDKTELCQKLKNFILANRRARVRILLQNTTLIRRHSHKLVGLSHHLPSYFEIKITSQEHSNYNSAFIVVDDIASIYCQIADRYEGTINFNNRRLANNLKQTFNQMWSQAKISQNLRRLSL